MNDESSERNPDGRWEEAERVMNAPLPTVWSALERPLDPRARDALIERALARRDAAPPRPAPRRLRRLWAAAAGLSLAAGLALFLRTSPEDGGLEIEMSPGRAEVRGSTAQHAALTTYSPRNEPGWKVHVPAAGGAAALRLYLVAENAGAGLTALEPAQERRDATFRIVGEVGALGLPAGEQTLHFVVGPIGARDQAAAIVEGSRAGERPPRPWRVESRRITVTE